MLNAESVCHATAGPWELELLINCHGGEETSKAEDRGKKRRSALVGADEYEYELYWSVFPP